MTLKYPSGHEFRSILTKYGLCAEIVPAENNIVVKKVLTITIAYAEYEI